MLIQEFMTDRKLQIAKDVQMGQRFAILQSVILWISRGHIR